MSALASCWPVGLLFLAGCLVLASSRPGTRTEIVGAILALSSALAFPICAWMAFA